MRFPRLLSRARAAPRTGPLADLDDLPLISADTPLVEVEFAAVDLETTGLDPRRNEVLSIGLVPVWGGQVHLSGARHWRVRPGGEVGKSAVYHGLTDDDLAAAPTLEQVLPLVLAELTGTDSPGRAELAGTHPPRLPEGGRRRRVLLAHFAQIESDFLDVACRRAYGSRLRLQVADTMEIQRRLLGGQHHELRPGTLRLDACRHAHHLPRYRAHSALTDAIACAELFLAQCAVLAERRGRELVLGDVLER